MPEASTQIEALATNSTKVAGKHVTPLVVRAQQHMIKLVAVPWGTSLGPNVQHTVHVQELYTKKKKCTTTVPR